MPTPTPKLARALAALGLMLPCTTTGVAFAQKPALIMTLTGVREVVDTGATALSGILTSHGYVPELREVDSITDLGDLSAYACVWDLRIDFALSPGQQNELITYASTGGGIYMSGEHGTFDFRNSSITQMLTLLGGGGVLTGIDPPRSAVPADYPETVNPLHPLATECLTVNEVVYDGVDHGRFVDVGFGTPLSSVPGWIGAAVWDAGFLFNAPTARAAFVLDSNWLSDGLTGTLDFRADKVTPTENRALANNMVGYLCGPECCTAAPFALTAKLPRSPLSPRTPKSPDSSGCSTSSASFHREGARDWQPSEAPSQLITPTGRERNLGNSSVPGGSASVLDATSPNSERKSVVTARSRASLSADGANPGNSDTTRPPATQSPTIIIAEP